MMNLIPGYRHPDAPPNYWCTWNAQHPMWYIATDEEWQTFDIYKATEGGHAARAQMNETALLHNPGWAVNFWPAERSDLYLCLDDGWDVPPNIDARTERWRFGSLILDGERFPRFGGGSPAERLRRLNEHLQSLGWRGLAVWVSAQCMGDGRDGVCVSPEACEAYWRERLRWSAQAGVEYWKVDWGAREHDIPFRRLLTHLARQEAPQLRIEHAWCMPPVNAIPGTGRFADDVHTLESSTEVLSFSDVFRSYDVMGPIGLASTLDRLRAWLERVQMDAEAEGLINCEDEVYLGAAMGFTIGIMRVPVRGPYTGWKWPRIDEVARAVRWQRIAPAFGIACNRFCASPQELRDSYRVGEDFYYDVIAGKEIEQWAPAVMSRGLPLPKVVCAGEPPFVVAARNPNGAVSVAALPRCLQSQVRYPLADVEIELDTATQPVGVFGRYHRLTLRWAEAVAIERIWAQDLLAECAVDITGRVRYSTESITLDGTLIAEIGLLAATADDPSAPGLVLQIETSPRR